MEFEFEDIHKKYKEIIRRKAIKFCNIIGFSYYDDFLQVGLIGLWKGYVWFDPHKMINKKHTFDYNMNMFLTNEMKMLYRKIKKTNYNHNEIIKCLPVISSDINFNTIDKMILEIIRKVLNNSSEVNRDIFNLWLINKIMENHAFYDTIINFISFKYNKNINKNTIVRQVNKIKSKLIVKIGKYLKNNENIISEG